MLAPVLMLSCQAVWPIRPAEPQALERAMPCTSAAVRRMLSSSEAVGSPNGSSVTCDRRSGLGYAQGEHRGLTSRVHALADWVRRAGRSYRRGGR